MLLQNFVKLKLQYNKTKGNLAIREKRQGKHKMAHLFLLLYLVRFRGEFLNLNVGTAQEVKLNL